MIGLMDKYIYKLNKYNEENGKEDNTSRWYSP
jgi:hypothetical protein